MSIIEELRITVIISILFSMVIQYVTLTLISIANCVDSRNHSIKQIGPSNKAWIPFYYIYSLYLLCFKIDRLNSKK